MFKHLTISNEGYHLDEILSQQTEGLIEQELTTLYRDKDGHIWQYKSTRSYTRNDYHDSHHSKFIG